ncbi:inositol monophosphatase family protein [Longimicrobium sp.]|uniref:inositol monophosphatase family protein n=1 Tax=Longimicrobium sp. TaxID=2029185 RepID=UPI003B3A3195
MTDDTAPFAPELETALQAASAAAALILGRGGAEEVREKGRADLVTAVDEAAERTIAHVIRARFPGDRIIGEELSSERVHAGRRWYVDPIDGTTNFIHGHPFVCVSIGFADDEGLAAGVIHAPLLGEVYRATRGGGAWMNGARIRVTETDDPTRALLATGFPFKRGKGELDAYMLLVADAIRGSRDVRRAGSAALDLAFVAAGRVDGFFEIGLAPWDVAAGMLLVHEAGGLVTGWPGDADPPLHTGRVLATNGGIHGWLDALAAKHLPRLGTGGEAPGE